MIVVETGALVAGANSWVSESEFTDWLTAERYTVTESADYLLPKAFRFLSTLNWRIPHSVEYVVQPDFKYAQMQLAVFIDSGKFDPDAQIEDKTLTEKGLGRGAIVKKWQAKSELSGISLIDLLKRFPSVYSFLQNHVADGGAGSFELVR